MVSQIRPFGSDIDSGQGLFSDPLTDTIITGSISSLYPPDGSGAGNDLNITATQGEPGFNGGVIRIVGGQNGFGSSGTGGYVDIAGGQGLGTTAGDVYIHSGLGYGGGTTGTVFIGYTPDGFSHVDTVVTVGDQAEPGRTTFNVYANTTNLQRTTATQAQLGTDNATNGLILVQPGGTQIGGLTGPPITLGPVYYDPANGMTIRFGASIFVDGDGVVNTINGRDATTPLNQIYYEVPGPPSDFFDLSTGGGLDEFPVVPGTVVVQGILEGGTVFSSVTDNGAGAFPASPILPGGGTVNYSTGALTGTTDLLEPYSQIVVYYVVADTAGEALTPRGGNGVGTGAGGALNLFGGNAGTSGTTGGDILIQSGEGPTTGNVTIYGNSATTGGTGGFTSIQGGDVVGGAGTGGYAELIGGQGGATGTAGDVFIRGGYGGTTSGNGGVVHIDGGAVTDGNGGAVNIVAGSGNGGGNPGGNIFRAGHTNGGDASSTYVEIYGAWGTPDVDFPSNTGNGGLVIIEAGGSSAGFNGGDLQLFSGSAYEATGNGGDVYLEAGLGGATSGNSGNIFVTAGGLPGTGTRGQIRTNGRMVVAANSASIAAANDLTLGNTGNYFLITGNTTINRIASADWGVGAGAVVILQFSGTPTIANNVAAGGGFLPIRLAGNTDLTTLTAGSTLVLYYAIDSWREMSRTIL